MIPEYLTAGSDGAPGPSHGNTAADLLRRGQIAARHGEFTRAARLLRAVLVADPVNIEARLWLAAVLEDVREAVRLLDEVLRLRPGHRRALAGRQWAAERLAARAKARPIPYLPPRPHVQPLAEQPVGHSPWGRVVVCLACLLVVLVAGAFAVTSHTWAEVLPQSYEPGADLPAPIDPMAEPSPTAMAMPAESLPTETPLPLEMPLPAALPTVVPTAEASPLPPTELPPPTAALEPTVQPTAGPDLVTDDGQDSSDDAEKTGKWIEVILSEQVAIAWQGRTAVRRMVVSTGLPSHPTVTGSYHIYYKVRSQRMVGPDYNLPNVPNIMYFYRGFALHGTYWHSNFGQPMSHGCVNLAQADAAWLFDWTGPALPPGRLGVTATADNPGTLVVVHQ